MFWFLKNVPKLLWYWWLKYVIFFQKLEVKWSMDKIENSKMTQNQNEAASKSMKNDGKHENTDEGFLWIFPRLSLCVCKKRNSSIFYLSFSDLSDTNADILKSMQRFISEEDEIKEATKIASTFVAGIMASAVADYIKVIYDDNHESHRLVSAAQVPISIPLTNLIILCLLVGWLHALKGSLGSRHSATPDVSFKCAQVQCELSAEIITGITA